MTVGSRERERRSKLGVRSDSERRIRGSRRDEAISLWLPQMQFDDIFNFVREHGSRGKSEKYRIKRRRMEKNEWERVWRKELTALRQPDCRG